jgi:hypothetical protein
MASQVFSLSRVMNYCALLRTILVSVLLVLSVFPALMLAVTPYAYSQAYMTTATSTIYSNAFVVSKYSNSGGSITCFYQDIQLAEGLAGTELFGTVSASGPINFWVLSTSQFNGFKTASLPSRGTGSAVCSRLVPPTARVAAKGITSYSLDWTVPDSDAYYFVFSNPGSIDAIVTFSYWSLHISTITPTSYQPTYSTYYASSTPTSYSSVASQQVLSQNFNYVPLVFLVAVGAGVVLFLIWNHGRSTEPKSEVTTKKRVTIPKEAAPPARGEATRTGKVFCINCGKELPADWKFCRHCGTKQP